MKNRKSLKMCEFMPMKLGSATGILAFDKAKSANILYRFSKYRLIMRENSVIPSIIGKQVINETH